MVISDFSALFVCDMHVYMHFLVCIADIYVVCMYVCMQMHVCGGLRLVESFCITPLPYSLRQCLSVRIIGYPYSSLLQPALSGESLVSAFHDFNYRQTCMSMWYSYRFLGYELEFYAFRVSAGTAELCLQPVGILCSNHIVTPATINLISKGSCIPLLTLQDLLYTLEEDIKCCCLVLPPCWKLHTQPCL